VIRYAKLIVYGLLALLTILISTGCGDSPNRRASQLKSEIGTQLSARADYTAVIMFLDHKGIEHTEYSVAGGDKQLLKLLGAPGRIEGVIRNVQRGLFSRSDIRLIFLFDERGKMSSYDVVVSTTT